MSQSPTHSKDPVRGYLKAFEQLTALIILGRSFSGYERNCCFLNTGSERFADVSAASGLDLIDDSRSIALVDWDHDGDLDLWMTHRTGPRVRMMRNDVRTSNHFLELKLEGTTCNRDAVGARVELFLGGGRKLIKTLRAGDGFLSQSSKWIHFGLGSEKNIERLIVRWPGSRKGETFEGLKADQRFQIVQGAGIAKLSGLMARKIRLNPSVPKVPKAPDRNRVFLSRRQNLPDLKYRDFNGAQHSIVDQSKGARLIILWASWCKPCLEELQELAQYAKDIKKKDLKILALCTDPITLSDASDLSAARAFLKRIKFPFSTGIATQAIVRDLTTIQNKALYYDRPLQLPSSFLVDPQSKVMAFYKGRLDVERLLSDLNLLNLSKVTEPELRKATLPFTGRFAIGLFRWGAVARANTYREGNYLADARKELKQYLKKSIAPTSPPQGNDQPGGAELARAFYLLASIEQEMGLFAEAESTCRECVRLFPKQPQTHLALAIALWHGGKHELAKESFLTVIQLRPKNYFTLRHVADAYLSLQAPKEALVLYDQAIKLSPKSHELRLSRAMALEQLGRTAEAIEEFRQRLDHKFYGLRAYSKLAWIYATHPEARFRDAEQSLKLAQQLCEQTHNEVPRYLGVLAAAYAESGKFSQAVQTANQAIQLAKSTGKLELAEQLKQQRTFYQQDKPFRDTGKVEPKETDKGKEALNKKP